MYPCYMQISFVQVTRSMFLLPVPCCISTFLRNNRAECREKSKAVYCTVKNEIAKI